MSGDRLDNECPEQMPNGDMRSNELRYPPGPFCYASATRQQLADRLQGNRALTESYFWHIDRVWLAQRAVWLDNERILEELFRRANTNVEPSAPLSGDT
jgi:hypothetical protein